MACHRLCKRARPSFTGVREPSDLETGGTYSIDRPTRFRRTASTGGGGWLSATRACVSFRYDHIVLWCNDVARVGHCHGLYAAGDRCPPDSHTTRHLVLIADTRLTKGRHTSMAGGGGFEDVDGQRDAIWKLTTRDVNDWEEGQIPLNFGYDYNVSTFFFI